MKLQPIIAALVVGAGLPALAQAQSADWPTSVTADNGVKTTVKGNFQYDGNWFTNDRLANGSHLFDDARGWRRTEVDVSIEKKDAFEIAAGYDFSAHAWTDTYFALETHAGKFQLGEFRTPVGWESATVSGAKTTFMEAALPVSATYQGRRAGLGWTYAKIPHWTLQADWFAAHDLNHDGDGATIAARAVYAPVATKTEVVHLGVAASRESRQDGTAQFNTPPEVHLTPVTLVDTGVLTGVDHINRIGLEGGWMQGPLLLQGEYLHAHADRDAMPDYDNHGFYVSAAWMLTGESRSYDKTAFGDPDPTHGWGALELAVRYSNAHLNDSPVQAGIEHDWTLGLNWYISKQFKLQANIIRAESDRGNLKVSPTVYGLRAQLAF
ncbi:MAG TPA: porin [Rhodanobacteraceae bacterium]|nr:porin [Rhodanobacteraceae bacterium]